LGGESISGLARFQPSIILEGVLVEQNRD
jgi:hypothetical protein